MIAKYVTEAECLLDKLEREGLGNTCIKEIRSAVAKAIWCLLPEDIRGAEPTRLMTALDAMLDSSRANRDALLFTARLLDVPGILPEGEANDTRHFQRRFVTEFENAIPDISKLLALNEKRQTIDKIAALRGLHVHVRQLLEPLGHTPTSSTAFAASKQGAFKTLNNPLVKSYLHPYGLAERTVIIHEIYNAIGELLACADVSFVLKLESCAQTLGEAEGASGDDKDVFSAHAFRPFLKAAREVLSEVQRQSVGRLRCVIKPVRPAPNVIERRFPLHKGNRIIRATLPLVNDGPGMALDTVVSVVSDTDELYIQSERIVVGAVQPGKFAVTLNLLLGDPTPAVSLLVEVEWSTAQSTARHATSFEVVLSAQKPDVPWDELEADDPYSTEVAHGDEFVGRRSRVTGIGGRLLRQHMQSSYITGQKRVGKTSLSFAVADYVAMQQSDADYEFIYLEYGEYASSNADKTVAALGQAIANRLAIFIPMEFRPAQMDFSGSIAPLNQLAQQLVMLRPNTRFVLVLDEFDEIHPEMYRFGPLAEAFFSNLRTLSAKSNVALMLVGGENMPFIIGAQGDQLNKFVPEQLSYFSRSSEWEDFVDLVRLKDQSPLTWYEAALAEIFRITNGHPYYTKLLCARIFQNAVADRDTEVTVDEVEKAMRGISGALDTNAFAHFWKDGIPAERDEAEVIELKRKRVLVAVAQACRAAEPLSHDNIIKNVRSLSIAGSEVLPILTDFVRRDILRDRGGEYSFVLPLFEHWLVQHGVSKLIADNLGDEMAEALRALEDKAFVGAAEIADVIESWPPYMGRTITVGDVQAWLEQRPMLRDRRLLFNLLSHLRFVREEDVRELLRGAHSVVKQHMGAFTPENRSQRRFDVIVTYVDGPGKSGARYADKYAEVNLISSTCVVEQNDIEGAIKEVEKKRDLNIKGIVIIDDIAGTGNTLAENLHAFVARNRSLLNARKIPIVVIALLATRNADSHIRHVMAEFDGIDIDLRVCEFVADRYFAFTEKDNIWTDTEELARAKALVQDIGRAVQKNAPLGFGDLGLLVAFTDTVPNNTIPAIHAGGQGWKPLLPRPKN